MPPAPAPGASAVTAAAVDTYVESMRAAQATRNDFIQLLSNPDIAAVVNGTFVRVLLELDDSSEDYMVARVCGTASGEQYNGFSQNPNQATTLYLRLQLPDAFSVGNGNLYQLNSISNSPLSRREVETWLSLTPDERRSEPAESLTIGARLRAVVPHRPRGSRSQPNREASPQAAAQPAPPVAPAPALSAPSAVAVPSLNSTVNSGPPQQATQLTSSRSGNLPATQRPTNDATSPSTHGGGRSAARLENAMPAPDAREVCYRRVVKERAADSTLFRRNIPTIRTSDLRTMERDVRDYLERVQEVLNSKRQRCVVCLDQMPTVIIMPCRHCVLCRWCSLQVMNCPMCRGVATEIFEPVEI